MLYKTTREYQSAYADFMRLTQGLSFLDGTTNAKLCKPDLFESIWNNHVGVSPGSEFRLEKDVTYQLLLKNNHPEIRTVDRKFVDVNEDELLREALKEVCKRRAISIVRGKVKTPEISTIEAVELVACAMERAYENYSDIESEVESKLKLAQ